MKKITLSLMMLCFALMVVGSVSAVEDECGDEICGLTENSNDCPADCSPVCGNNVTEIGEVCDNGVANHEVGSMSPVWNLLMGGGDRTYCSTECDTFFVPGTWCGDASLNGPEECDDGNLENEDGCSSVCMDEDHEGPTINVNSPPVWPNCEIYPQISADISDPSGIKFGSVRLNYKYDGYDWDQVSFMNPPVGDIYSLYVNWFVPADGEEFIYTIEAKDNSPFNNWAVSGEYSFTYDCEIPTAVLTGAITVDEGATETYDASGSNDSASSISFEWDCEYEESSPNWVSGSSTHDCSWPDDAIPIVAVKVTDEAGNSAIATLGVTVNNVAPVVEAGADQSVNEGDLVTITPTFTDEGVLDTHTATVNWGDGTTNSAYSHIYPHDGVYTVTVTVTDDDGGVGSDSLTINVDAVPIADFSATPLSGTEPLEVQFTSLSTGYDQPLSYAWDFECDEVVDSTDENLTHTYGQDGTYTVCLTVIDSDESTDTETKVDYITVGDTDPIADFLCSPLVGTSPLTTYCTDESTSQDGIVSWYWQVTCESGESSESDSKNPTFTFYQEGSCDVSLIVSEGDGDTDSEIKEDYLTVYKYSIDLLSGWNLISIPLVPEDDNTNIDFVFGGIADKAEVLWEYKYDESEGKNVWNYNEVEDGWDSDLDRVQNIIPGYGYYIKMDEEATVYQNGEKFYGVGDVVPMPPQVQLTTGWNLIGHYGLNYVPKLFEKNDLSGGDLRNLADVNLLNETAAPAYVLEPTEGYWAFITGQNNLWYAPSGADYSEIY